jgi:hypothetical protein
LDSEIIPRLLKEEVDFITRSQSSSNSSSSINYSNPSFEGENHHHHSNDRQIIEHAFIAD